MKIKNIQQFRTQWRNQQGYDMPNWEENFIGSIHGEKSGFYKMVNGIVNNIKADLTPKLQNAQDGQAIYEFLQNAADSKSTECAIIYDENYFMVLNNGKPFTEKDLRALLNSFQGTKADKTKPDNCEKIGRYGIGFKLAYRLMGKSDGAEELLKDLAGPLLFSWHNSAQLKELQSGQALSKLDLSDLGTDTAPWLLKIILACFPTAPEEEVFDLDYQRKVLFHKEEVQELVNFLEKKKDLLANLDLKQGSLFFLKFGPKKHEKLKDSLLNIKSGIGYAMNTLKTLEKVVLQDEVIEQYEAEFEHYAILPATNDFKKIDPEFKFCPIDISLGFPKTIQQNVELKNAPSLYQFFPMSNERHSMAYYVHASSFAKITDRTRLDDQGEANIETLSYISRVLQRNLLTYKQKDFDRFAFIYRALLLTDRSTEYDAHLMNEHLYNPMLNFIQLHIPTHKRNFYPKELVILKDTRLPIDPMTLGIGKEWFLWADLDTEIEVIRSAANTAKLGLKRWGLRELMLEGNPMLFNTWIQGLADEDYQTFIKELKDVNLDEEFLTRFNEIKAFKFTDNSGNVSYFAINDLQDQEDVFLMSERTLSIKEEIRELGFSVLEFNILDYAAILKKLESQLNYLTDDKAMFQKLTAKTAQASLNVSQKHNLFEFLLSLEGIAAKELQNVQLFENEAGHVVALKSILASDIELESWLEGFKIKADEYTESLNPYLVNSSNLWEVYANILLPHWNIVTELYQSENQEYTALYESVHKYYALKSGLVRFSQQPFILTQEDESFQAQEQIFYHKALQEIEDYSTLSTAICKLTQKYIPQKPILAFLERDPFKTQVVTSDKMWKKSLNTFIGSIKNTEFTPAEKIALFQVLQGILSTKDLQRIELFSNQNGDRSTLAQLIASDADVPAWLKGFRLKAEESHELLADYWAKDAEIYENVILNNWSKLSKQSTVSANISDFYKQISKYAALARTPKPLNHLDYIFVNKEVGFVNKTQVYYHKAMQEYSAYAKLQTAIKHTTTAHCPHPAVLPFLEERIFFTKEASFAKVLNIQEDTTLEKEEAISLVRFMNETKEDIFTIICIEEGDSSREYKLYKKSGLKQFALEKSQQKLVSKIRLVFDEKYKLLPVKLYFPELRNKGLLAGSELFKLLSKSKNAPSELLSAIIMESGNTDIQQQVFQKIDKIVLKLGQTYTKDSFEHQALQVFRNKEADYDKVRSKIYIENPEGDLLKLVDIAYSKDVIISIDRRGKFNLSLEDILPKFKAIYQLFDQILKQFVDYEAPTLLRKKCFESKECPEQKLLRMLRQDYPVLENAAQLGFVLLIAKRDDNIKVLKDFSVHSLAEEPTALHQHDLYYLNNKAFLDPSSVLDASIYKKLNEVLEMNDKYPIFDFGEQQVLDAPTIVKNTFYCTPLRDLAEEEHAAQIQLEVLNYVYKKWSDLPAENRPTELKINTQDEANELLGLDFSSLVYPNELALVKERLPEFLGQWLGTETKELTENIKVESSEDTISVPKGKLSFLKALAVNTPSSSLIQLRQFLIGQASEEVSQKLLNELRNQERNHLFNTILWLQAEGTSFEHESTQLYWLRKVYNTLPKIGNNTPLPRIHKANKKSWSYMISSVADTNLYYFDNKYQQALEEKFEITLVDVYKALEKTGAFLTNLDIKGADTISNRPEKVLDLEMLQNQSQEWGADHYMEWRKESEYAIYLYQDKMPYKIEYLDHTIKTFSEGQAVLSEQIAYVNSQSKNIEEDLFAITRSKGFTEALLLQLLRLKNSTKESSQTHKVIEKVIETVVVEEQLGEHEEAIKDPSMEEILEYKEAENKAKLKMAFDLKTLPEELLSELMKYATNSKMIVEKNKVKN
ncbi:MAG: ATP-binding protein [Saprospiraceae bacterium]|nr:ATP-binding protein [Saprospiraceae bacterium]